MLIANSITLNQAITTRKVTKQTHVLLVYLCDVKASKINDDVMKLISTMNRTRKRDNNNINYVCGVGMPWWLTNGKYTNKVLV